MRCALVNRIPVTRADLMWKQVPRSSIRNNKVSPWPRKAVRPLVLLLQAPNDATRNKRLGSDVIVSTALQNI